MGGALECVMEILHLISGVRPLAELLPSAFGSFFNFIGRKLFGLFQSSKASGQTPPPVLSPTQVGRAHSSGSISTWAQNTGDKPISYKLCLQRGIGSWLFLGYTLLMSFKRSLNQMIENRKLKNRTWATSLVYLSSGFQ
jgi:hypothetical protein